MKKIAHYQTLEYDRIVTLMRSYARDRAGLRVLDFGCGLGKFLACFKELGLDVVGVDMNLDYVARAREQGYSAYAPEEFFRRNDAPFDVIFLSHLVEHVAPDDLVGLIPRLCALLGEHGRLVLLTPTPGERFYHDFSHIRPYLPQSIRHAFGNTGMPLSYGEAALIELVDIYFFRDPYRTRGWRSFYVGSGVKRMLTRWLNAAFDGLWRLSGGRIGVQASWLGVYRIKR
ncbi:class I SAM-dependent methyltransferase [Achromobacter aloeverae]|uniref:Methyltransferase n=1 Tax=Achromobacter aloeverae TaxID=1750518 RepID=A0A4Q1HNM4_9BURK|nr:class I SAM-dependent methyltransferase [Achromobacter aloeverae]RXN92588.1 methyltransferase [Achromobacter aloeverae]